MKPSGPLRRRTPLKRSGTRNPRSLKACLDDIRRDIEWRQEVLLIRSPQCRVTAHLMRIPALYRTPQQRQLVASCDGPIEVDHLIPRSPATRWALPNGCPMCRHHHRLKTEHSLLIAPEWLDPDQLRWLEDEGHAEWLLDGVVVGRHRTLFADGPDRRGPQPSPTERWRYL